MQNTQKDNTKVCSSCDEELPLSFFYHSSKRISSRCKQCLKFYYQERYAENKDEILTKSRAWSKEHPNKRRLTPSERLQRKYNITLEDKKRLAEAQEGKCAICESNLQWDDPHEVVVDHCHKQGHIRGILCRKCNCLLGFAADSVETLSNAIQYLTKR